MITIGVAGHIDHGKSSIVKRLTGTDPDRLPEEKLRGMTIDLGFAHWMGPAHGMSPANGNSQSHSNNNSVEPLVAFVDVPGHERFVRNMIAGAGGIEGVILVVAADDGWMPQSQEHFDIVRLLGVKKGFVVLSKIDLVEPDWIETVVDDIKTQVSGSFLDGAPVIPVSSTTGHGFDKLENELLLLAKKNLSQADLGKPRLFIDRSFDISGMGKVVTGTLRGGAFEVGQKIFIHPSGAEGKIRTLQRHG
ncbi:MAG: 50S ribosome-binding GTPase, partial [candidate division Zixibacteria bacterium]|nr:50S ribosome-binding GTPase [candidate division Zixibacteria bacterium]